MYWHTFLLSDKQGWKYQLEIDIVIRYFLIIEYRISLLSLSNAPLPYFFAW